MHQLAHTEQELSQMKKCHRLLIHTRVIVQFLTQKRLGSPNIRHFCFLAGTLSKGNEIHDLEITAQANSIGY